MEEPKKSKFKAFSTKTMQVLRFWVKIWSIFIIISFVLRCSHLALNQGLIAGIDFYQLPKALFFGLRLDHIVAFYVLSPFLLLAAIISYINQKAAKTVLHFTISVFFIAYILLVVTSHAYFNISKQHIGASLFTFLGAENNISILVYLRDYYWAVIFCIVLLIITLWRSGVIIKKLPRGGLLAHILIIAISFIFARGGIRLRPLRNADAGNYVSQNLISFAQNPALILADDLLYAEVPPSFLVDQACEGFKPTPSFEYASKKNIIIVILESFGKEYTALNKATLPSYTPFLDSLSAVSTVFTNAYAAGTKSMDAVPAIFLGLPKITNTSFISGSNANKTYPSLITELKKKGYKSHFFHGAHPETMGFQSFLKNNGLENYWSKTDYPSNKNHLNEWGVFDHYFFDFAVKKINKLEEPFLAGFFTLSSHHPYTIPIEFKNKFPKGKLPIHESIGYADFALKSFMDNCSKTPWYNNSLFVILADHSSENSSAMYRTSIGKYAIPIVIFDPVKQKSVLINSSIGQVDIPVLLKQYIEFGYIKDENKPVIHFTNGTYQITLGEWVLGIDEDGISSYLYNIEIDPYCKNNLKNMEPAQVEKLHKLLVKKISCTWNYCN